MKEVTISINFGGYVGADKEVTFRVPDSYTEDDIDTEATRIYEDTVLEDSSWEITDISEDEEED